MRVLISGASGLIGSALSAALIRGGDQVIGLSRDPARAARAAPRVSWHPWDAASEQPPAAALDGIDAVVNLAGEPINQRWSEGAKRRIMQSRREGTGNLIEAIAAQGRRPEVLLCGSAIGYYGDRGAEPVDESAGPGEDFAARVVVEWERAAQAAAELGIRLVVVRTGHVLDPRGGLLGQLLRPFRLGLGGPIAGGRQYLSWIHIEDEVGILERALRDREVSGTLNATAPNPATNAEFAGTLGAVLRRPAILPVPRVALSLLFGREFAGVLAAGQRVLPRRALELGYGFSQPELEPALRQLLGR